MTRSNRVLNRIVLFVLGIVAVVAGIIAGAGVLPVVRDRLRALGVTVPGRLVLDASTLWIVAGACAVVLVLAVLWIVTRGRGGTSIAVREQHDADQVTVNVGLVRDVVEHELDGMADILSTRVDLYRVRASRAARIRVAVRRGGDAVGVLAAVDAALSTLDRTLGRTVPAVVHLTGGTRSALARSTRVQ
jgi:hypothetical protein